MPRKPAPSRRLAASLAFAAAGPHAGAQAHRLVASEPIGPVVVTTNQAVPVAVDFSGVDEPITGIGLTGTYVTQQGDFGGGLGPWSLDVRLTATAPGGGQLAWNPIGGDVTIADYPFQDATPGFNGVSGDGQWTFAFDSVEPVSNWIYRVDNAAVHLLGPSPELTVTFTAEPDPGSSWDRPFFIEGVSGLGPVSFHAFEFAVTRAGLYDLTSVLSTGNDHFTFLYSGGFDPAQPLTNLLDYGLGNGSSPFGVPEGTSRITALLFEGVTYTWVTSQWGAFSPIAPADNTITGPGRPIGGCPADVNSDGVLDGGDFFAWVAAFNTADPACDQNFDSLCDVGDFFAWVAAFGQGC